MTQVTPIQQLAIVALLKCGFDPEDIINMRVEEWTPPIGGHNARWCRSSTTFFCYKELYISLDAWEHLRQAINDRPSAWRGLVFQMPRTCWFVRKLHRDEVLVAAEQGIT
jgi:hypothetical protein